MWLNACPLSQDLIQMVAVIRLCLCLLHLLLLLSHRASPSILHRQLAKLNICATRHRPMLVLTSLRCICYLRPSFRRSKAKRWKEREVSGLPFRPVQSNNHPRRWSFANRGRGLQHQARRPRPSRKSRSWSIRKSWGGSPLKCSWRSSTTRGRCWWSPPAHSSQLLLRPSWHARPAQLPTQDASCHPSLRCLRSLHSSRGSPFRRFHPWPIWGTRRESLKRSTRCTSAPLPPQHPPPRSTARTALEPLHRRRTSPTTSFSLCKRHIWPRAGPNWRPTRRISIPAANLCGNVCHPSKSEWDLSGGGRCVSSERGPERDWLVGWLLKGWQRDSVQWVERVFCV